ncbi:MAG TPA: type II toxin-antitoxin system prevent-host-death family antitoxin [Polyangia bacterium]|jgi:prevent-host-death family protein|nr:type II toxin-antitoxin system prevent-host-death family antitoxin [Polyangia bacterium]
MLKVNIHEAKANLSKYVEAAEAGETVIICNRNVPVAELRGLPQQRTKARPIGLARGLFKVPATFFEPLPDDVLTGFRGGS